MLLANGANINAKDDNEKTALDYAQKKNYTTIVEYLKNPDSKTMTKNHKTFQKTNKKPKVPEID